MRIPHRSPRATLGFNMTPMIDVVFLLIIFFLVSSHLARQESQLALDLPAATTGRADRPRQEARRVVVNVLGEPRGGRRIQIGGRLLDAEELADVIRHEREHTEGGLEVRIRCDRRVPYRDVEPVMLACARSGVWNVTFAVVAGATNQP
ncbi:MAG: biopolymer transporter ExbD [Pirellulales bacterium]|nr:biopolymer transporter ExbD [Pirellulales bacterium]